MDSPAARAGYDQARSAYEIGRMVCELREARGLSQRELAARMGTTQSVVGRLEAGGSRPTIVTLDRVASALGVRLEVRFHDLQGSHGDLDQREATWTTHDVGYRLGVELGHGEQIGWSYETASWLSLMDELWVDVLEAAEEGVRVSPLRSSARVQNMLKVAHAAAALREPTRSERALDDAAEVVASMDPSDRPEHRFVFDAAKFDMFAAHVYTEAAAHARISIERSDDPSSPARYHPIRAMAALSP